ncbi:hypothetical protein VM1G_07665 [Cytospora mali]|uniref:Uncharacterized protein n=1 Tax=Cytospora mali TaxID=578113 RepID=A0A194W8L8_CYTMA|nr:hypothetical protein VM1G_07665 [Valsa mali]
MLNTNSAFRVDGIVAVVTGGGTEAPAVNGAREVYILGRRLEVLKESAAKYPDIMVPIACDVTSKESIQSAVDQVSQDVGYINPLVANSGIAGPANHYNQSLSLADLRAQLLSASMEDFTHKLFT